MSRSPSLSSVACAERDRQLGGKRARREKKRQEQENDSQKDDGSAATKKREREAISEDDDASSARGEGPENCAVGGKGAPTMTDSMLAVV